MTELANTNKIIKASPTKELFITMLVRDVTLRDAIGDLIDNSVDGAKKFRGDSNYNGLKVEIQAFADKFFIKDNCGGIDADIARNYAFRFGRPKDTPPTPGSVGQFGIGMKRSLFKLGKYFTIRTVAKNSSFKMQVDVDKWESKEDDWNFIFNELTENQTNNDDCRFTEIEVTNLNNDVKEQFSDNNFIKKLHEEIEREHLYNISKGIKIIINGHTLKARKLSLIESDSFKTGYYEEDFDNGTKVKLYAGIGKAELKDGGWYLFCNNRLVVGPEQTELTGWTGGRIEGGPLYHNQFKRFRGYVFFEAEDSSKLPWNTTKNGMDRDSPRFKYVRSKMIELMKPVISFLNQLKKEREGESTSDERPLENLVDSSSITPINEYKDTNFANTFASPPPPSPVKQEQNQGKITYYMPKVLINKVKKHIGAANQREVGEKTFMYFYDMEING